MDRHKDSRDEAGGRGATNPSTDEQVLAAALVRLVAANPEAAREVAGDLRHGNVSVVELRASDLMLRMVDAAAGPLTVGFDGGTRDDEHGNAGRR